MVADVGGNVCAVPVAPTPRRFDERRARINNRTETCIQCIGLLIFNDFTYLM